MALPAKSYLKYFSGVAALNWASVKTAQKTDSIFVTIHHKKFTKNRHYPLFKEIQMW